MSNMQLNNINFYLISNGLSFFILMYINEKYFWDFYYAKIAKLQRN